MRRRLLTSQQHFSPGMFRLPTGITSHLQWFMIHILQDYQYIWHKTLQMSYKPEFIERSLITTYYKKIKSFILQTLILPPTANPATGVGVTRDSGLHLWTETHAWRQRTQPVSFSPAVSVRLNTVWWLLPRELELLRHGRSAGVTCLGALWFREITSSRFAGD